MYIKFLANTITNILAKQLTENFFQVFQLNERLREIKKATNFIWEQLKIGLNEAQIKLRGAINESLKRRPTSKAAIKNKAQKITPRIKL